MGKTFKVINSTIKCWDTGPGQCCAGAVSTRLNIPEVPKPQDTTPLGHHIPGTLHPEGTTFPEHHICGVPQPWGPTSPGYLITGVPHPWVPRPWELQSRVSQLWGFTPLRATFLGVPHPTPPSHPGPRCSTAGCFSPGCSCFSGPGGRWPVCLACQKSPHGGERGRR